MRDRILGSARRRVTSTHQAPFPSWRMQCLTNGWATIGTGHPELVRPLRVLLIELDVLISMNLETILEDGGHEVVGGAACFTSVEGRRHAADLPDLVVVGIESPIRRHGVETGRHLRDAYNLPVVFVSAWASDLTIRAEAADVSLVPVVNTMTADHDLVIAVEKVCVRRSEAN